MPVVVVGPGPSPAVVADVHVMPLASGQLPPHVAAAIRGELGETGPTAVDEILLDPAWSSVTLRIAGDAVDNRGPGTVGVFDGSGRTLARASLSGQTVDLTVPIGTPGMDAGGALYLAIVPTTGGAGGGGSKTPPVAGSASNGGDGSVPKFSNVESQPFQAKPSAPSPAVPVSPAPVSPDSGPIVAIEPGRVGDVRTGVGGGPAPLAIPLPTPTPPGVPAGGVFRQNGPGPGGVAASLPIDSVAADLPATVVPQALAAPARGFPIDPPGNVGRPAVLAVSPAGTSPTPTTSPYAVTTAARGGADRELAELPDVAVLLGAVPARSLPPSAAGVSVHAARSLSVLAPGGLVASVTGGMTDRPARSLAMEAWAATRRDGRAFGVVPVVIYGATSLALRGSGPGLASALRLRKEGDGED